MSLIPNIHPVFEGTPLPSPQVACAMDCVEKFIPKTQRKSPIFQKVNSLLCHYDNAWSDEEMRIYLTEIEEFFRSGAGTDFIILNWYSLLNWIQAGEYNWERAYTAGSFNSDFYSRYSMSTQDIWLSLSKTNDEAFNEDGFKYYEHFLNPYVGTNLIQRKLLEKVRGVDGEIIDWYQNGNITNAYSFQFAEFPGWDKAKVLIIGSKLLKNAESILISLKDENCPNRFILSHSFLDTDYLSDITSLRFEGVNICFQRYVSGNLTGFLDLFRIQKIYTKEHAQLIDYYIIRRLSDTLFLDDLLENRIYRTRTPDRPGRFVQLLPAWIPWENKWSAGVTWEDHYDWQGILIQRWVRMNMDNAEGVIPNWTSTDVWERWVNFTGNDILGDWFYNKPPASRNSYYEDRNHITGFGPDSGQSLYKPYIFSSKTRFFDEDANTFSGKKKVVLYWFNEDKTSENLELDGASTKFVFSQKTREDSSNYVKKIVDLGDLDVLEFNSTEHTNDANVNYWTELMYSENLLLDDEHNRTVFSKSERDPS